MTKDSDVEFEILLRSLILSPEETVRRNEFQEKIRTQVACAFGENDSSRNLDAFLYEWSEIYCEH